MDFSNRRWWLPAFRSFGWGFLCYQSLYVAVVLPALVGRPDLAWPNRSPIRELFEALGLCLPVPATVLSVLLSAGGRDWRRRGVVAVAGITAAAAIGLAAVAEALFAFAIPGLLLLWQLFSWSSVGCLILPVFRRGASEVGLGSVAWCSIIGVLAGACLWLTWVVIGVDLEAGTGEKYALGSLFVAPVLLATTLGCYLAARWWQGKYGGPPTPHPCATRPVT